MPTPDFSIESLRGGFNDEVPISQLAADECQIAENVEFFSSGIAERRLGGQGVDIAGSGIADDDLVVFATRHFPTKDLIDNELWGLSAVPGGSMTFHRKASGVWSVVTPTSPVSFSEPDIYQVQAQSFNGKLFFCAHLISGADRMLVWDGATLRLAGLAQPAAPAVANEGSGAFITTRYYRVRYIVKSGAVILRRSEPSLSTTFTPSGSGAGARITKPASISEGETQWEVEASYTPTGNYYLIATVAVGTTTYDDTTPNTTSYADVGTLSPEIGEYVPLPAARYVGVDEDRLLLGGDFVDNSQDSRVDWTPVLNDPGVGNDERIPANTDNFLNLDAKVGGGLEGISSVANGSWQAFKASRIYMLTRTGVASDAYVATLVTDARGALFGSIVSGLDEYGRACIYFADPTIGPCRIGLSGLQQIRGLRKTWTRVNASATKIAIRAIYYPFKQQVIWFVAVDGANTPTLGLKSQITELRQEGADVKRGWSFVTGLLATVTTATLYTEQLFDTSGRPYLSTRPLLGYAKPNYLLRADLGDDDNGTTFQARIRTRPFFVSGSLLDQSGFRSGGLFGTANGARMQVSFIRDFEAETSLVPTTLTSPHGELYVTKSLDNLVMEEAIAVQIEFGDVVNPAFVDGRMYHSELS